MDKIGDRRSVKQWAWLPTTLTNGKRIWWQPYFLVEEFQKWHRYPLGVPTPETLEVMAACSRDRDFAYQCLVDAAEIRDGFKSIYWTGWRCIEVIE